MRRQAEGAPRGAKAANLLLAVTIAAMCAAAYLPVLDNQFHRWDDNHYVTENARVLEGLTAENVKWAFTTVHFGFYYPVTWLSHMADVEMFGVSPRGHHLTSLTIHAANAVLLFFLLIAATGSTRWSFAAAAVFALHPMNVESVAWIAERKNILAAFFLLLCFLFYLARWRTNRGGAAGALCTAGYYASFALGLMSKSSIVMGPFLLILLDVWPLGRISPSAVLKDGKALFRLALEKVPLFLMSLVSGILTIIAQDRTGTALHPLSEIPFAQRAGEALLALGFYLGKFFLPVGISPFYPHHRGNYTALFPVAVALLLSAALFAAARIREKRPQVLVGLLFFLVSLLPVLGFIQVGEQGYAPRYVYFPYWGLLAALAFGVDWENALKKVPGGKVIAVLALAAVLAAFLSLTRGQVRVWKDDLTLFSKVVERFPGHPLGHYQVGYYYLERGEPGKAVEHLSRADELNPGNADTLCNLGHAYLGLKEYDRALDRLNASIEADPSFKTAYYNRGWLYLETGQGEKAVKDLEAAREKGFDVRRVEESLLRAKALAYDNAMDEGKKATESGDLAAAEAALARALRSRPDSDHAWTCLGFVLQAGGRTEDAERAYESAIGINPSNDLAIYNLALIMARRGDLAGARKKLGALDKMGSRFGPELRKAMGPGKS